MAAPPVLVKEKHLRLALRQRGRTITAMAWNQAEQQNWLRTAGVVDAAVSFDYDSRSESLGYPPRSVQIRDLRPHAATASAG